MDSGNSGSTQSSSGGDDEYDSRAAATSSLSAFFNPHVGGSLMPNPPLHPPPFSDHPHHFEPLSNYFNDPLSLSSSRSTHPPVLTNPNSLLNLDMLWSKNLRSDPSCTDLGAVGFASSSPSQTQQFFSNNHHQTPTTNTISTPGSVSASNDQVNNNGGGNMVRKPKKRSRASRRAPTTVLTTDTTNFRAMVQEFTGIPSPPFTSSSFPRSRLDLFGTPSSSFRSASVGHSPPPYLLRPFTQKIQPPPLPPLSASSIADTVASSTVVTTTANMNSSTNISIGNTNTLTSINYHQLPPDHLSSLLKQTQPQSQNFLDIAMHSNQILNFHPLVQLPTSSAMAAVAPSQRGSSSLEIPSSNDNNNNNLKMGVLEEFGLSSRSGNLSANPTGDGLTAAAAVPPRQPSQSDTALRRSNPPPQQNWEVHGSFNSSQPRAAANGKVGGYSAASSSGCHAEKEPPSPAPENVVTARGEGMLMESWICSD